VSPKPIENAQLKKFFISSKSLKYFEPFFHQSSVMAKAGVLQIMFKFLTIRMALKNKTKLDQLARNFNTTKNVLNGFLHWK